MPESPLIDELRSAGGRLGAVPADFAPYQVPLDYGDARREYDALVGATAVIDFSARTQIEVTGADRATFLHNMCTNEIRRLAAGAGCEAFLTNAKGHVLGLVYIFAGESSHTIETVSGQSAAILQQLDRYIIREDVQLIDRTAEWAELYLAGSAATKTLHSLGLQAAPNTLFAHSHASLGDVDTTVRNVDFTGPASFLIACSRGDAPQLWRAIREAGAIPCGYTAWEMARIEAGTPQFGRDIHDDNLPQEVARDQRAISFVKGCYIGQETVARIDALGHVNRLLRGVELAAPRVPDAATELTAAGQAVGEITSAANSPRLSKPLALAYVRRGHNTPATVLQCAGDEAVVIDLPLP